MNLPVVMLITMMGFNGYISTGVVPFESYEACYKSLVQTTDTGGFLRTERVCMSADSYDRLRISTIGR